MQRKSSKISFFSKSMHIKFKVDKKIRNTGTLRFLTTTNIVIKILMDIYYPFYNNLININKGLFKYLVIIFWPTPDTPPPPCDQV